jgi:hypothetical protein
MAIDERPRWGKWIWSSTANLMKTTANSLSLPLIVEGIDDRQPENLRASHAELRLNGPFIFEISAGIYQVQMPINILLVDYMQGDDNDAYRLQEWAGAFQAIMDKPIPIYRHGQDPEDDGSFLECLRVKKTRDGGVRVIHFGQISRMGTSDTLIRESAVDGMFEMLLNPTR